MAPAKRFTDDQLRQAWEQTGSIRATARRLGFAYSGVYLRLVRANLIKASPPRVERQYTPHVVPDGATLVIADTQAPAHHPDTLAFLCAVRDRYKPDNIVHIGDEVDLNFLSSYAKLPEVDQPQSEFGKALAFMRSFYAEFPSGYALVSNHVAGRLDQARQRGRILPQMLRNVEDIMDAPDGWSWHSELRMGDILFRHGHKDLQNLKRVIVEEIPAQTGRHYSLVIGHYHSKFGIGTPDIKVGGKLYWGAFTGCLIDPKHPFFGYSRGYERLGTLVILHGRPLPIPMELDERGRWTGRL